MCFVVYLCCVRGVEVGGGLQGFNQVESVIRSVHRKVFLAVESLEEVEEPYEEVKESM